MNNPPKNKKTWITRVVIEYYGYGSYSHAPFNPGYCAYEVLDRRQRGKQCRNKPGHGPAELYCPQHAKMILEYFKERKADDEQPAEKQG